MKVICTICSKEKDVAGNSLPARLRYLTPRIKAVGKIAKELKLPLFILSGKYGIISAEEMIPYYDHILKEEEISDLSRLISRQLEENHITEIDFYTKNEPAWLPYTQAIQKGIELSKIILNYYYL